MSIKHRSVWVANATLAAIAALALAIGLAALPCTAHAASSKVTEKLVLSTAKKYDANSYYLLSSMAKSGYDITVWWGSGDTLADSYDTAVHEECHGFTFVGGYNMRVYVGNKRSIVVPYTSVFRSKNMAKSIPKRLRTFRYDTYIGSPSPNLSSDIEGIYGIFNEFTAYCWGFSGQVKLYGYCSTLKQTQNLWQGYLANGYSSSLAYAEFRYYLEHYLVYAKKHNPKVYAGIMANKKFKQAVKKVDARFAASMKAYDKLLPKIAKSLQAKGYIMFRDGDYVCFKKAKASKWRGISSGVADYNMLAKELGKKKYKAIQKKLGLKTVKTRKVNLKTESQALKAYYKAKSTLNTNTTLKAASA